MLKVALREEYRYQLPPGHRFPMDKYELLPQQLVHEGTLTEENFFRPSPLKANEVLITHSDEYYQKLQTQTLSAREIRRIGFPMTRELVERGHYIAHGTYECAGYARQFGIAMNIAGGTHHAYPGHGEGFCVFNDIAIASNLLLERGEVERILVVDLDVHQGNGTAFIFRNDPRVFTFSIHGEKNYPLRKEQSDLDIPLPDGTTGKEYLPVLQATLDNLIPSVQPGLIFYLSGVDVLHTDKLGRMQLTLSECKERDRIVLQHAHDAAVPVVVTMGGGYSEHLRDIVEAHANTYRVAQEIFF